MRANFGCLEGAAFTQKGAGRDARAKYPDVLLLSMAEKPKKRPRQVSDGSGKKETRRSAEGLQSKKESDRRRGQTRITIGVAFPRWRALKERKGLRADTDLALLLLDRPLQDHCKTRYSAVPTLCGNYFFLRAGEKPDKRTAVKLGLNWLSLWLGDAQRVLLFKISKSLTHFACHYL